jgi:hypothetical protein
VIEQPDLFDVDEEGGAPCPQAGESPAATSSWREVPQVLFDSWPEKQQLAYCAARDEDSARYAEGEWRELYAARAATYRERLDGKR